MVLIEKYFDNITPAQKEQFREMGPLYADWNVRINVISRKDINHLYERHVLHSLSIAKWMAFQPGTRLLDAGCGGGFPGIPLAIYFPEVEFHLVDSIGKKIHVVHEVSKSLGLKNVRAEQVRAEKVKGKYDFVMSRAVAKIGKLISWNRNNISDDHKNARPNGFIFLKGGNIEQEFTSLRNIHPTEIVSIYDMMPEDYFKEKFIVYIQG